MKKRNILLTCQEKIPNMQAVKLILNRIWFYRWIIFIYRTKFILKPVLKKQFKDNFSHGCATSGPRILVPLIETNHYQYYQVLLLAKALMLRGAQVKILLCGSQLEGCEIKNIHRTTGDPCMTCRINARSLVPVFGLDTCNLSDFFNKKMIATIHEQAKLIASNYPLEYNYYDVDVIPMTNDSVVRHYYGKVPYDSEKEIRDIREKYLKSALLGIEAAHALSKEWAPEIILNNMNVYVDWAPYYQYFKRQQVLTYTISMSTFNFHAVVLNREELYLSNARYIQWLNNRTNHSLNNDEKLALQGVMESRFTGKARIFEKLECYNENNDVNKIINFNSALCNMFLFPNLFWDAGLSACGGLYDNVITWVLDTIELIKDNKECHLYIKPHPVEKFDQGGKSLRGIIDFIFEKYPILPENVTIIYPEFKIKPYELFPYIDMGLVFNGTLGLEMLMSSIPVIACGISPYSGLGLVSEPKTKIEYRDMLLKKIASVSPSRNKVELFNYFYFVKTTIPWHLTRNVYADNFKGFTIDSLDDLLPGKDKYLDHICDCILDRENTIIEGWM